MDWGSASRIGWIYTWTSPKLSRLCLWQFLDCWKRIHMQTSLASVSERVPSASTSLRYLHWKRPLLCKGSIMELCRCCCSPGEWPALWGTATCRSFLCPWEWWTQMQLPLLQQCCWPPLPWWHKNQTWGQDLCISIPYHWYCHQVANTVHSPN